MATKLRPLGDKSSSSASRPRPRPSPGIVLPDSAKEKPERGKVLALGAGKRLDSGELFPFTVKVGNEVLFTSYGGPQRSILVSVTANSRGGVSSGSRSADKRPYPARIAREGIRGECRN